MQPVLAVVVLAGAVLLFLVGLHLVVQVVRGTAVVSVPKLERDKSNPKKVRKSLTSVQSQENEDLGRRMQELNERLNGISSMLKEFRSTVKNQLRNPYFMDQRNATVRSLYAAVDRARQARPVIPEGGRFIDHQESIEDFAHEVTILENVIRKAVADSKTYRLNDAELTHWKRANSLYAEVFENPASNEYSRVALLADFHDACAHLPFITFDKVLDVEAADAEFTQ